MFSGLVCYHTFRIFTGFRKEKMANYDEVVLYHRHQWIHNNERAHCKALGVNKKCKVRIAAHTAILKFDRRVALRSAMPAAFLCRQCIPASLHRAATSVLQADSIMPDPM